MTKTNTESTYNLTAAMPHTKSNAFNYAGVGLGKLVAALLLLGSVLVQEPVEAQILRSVERASARAAVGASARRAAQRAIPRQQVRRQPCAAIPNKCAGLKREAAARRILASKYPNERIQAETWLRNRDGSLARDPITGEARRIDFVLFSNGRVSRRYEVTSQNSAKNAQLAKEQRIYARQVNGRRRTGPVYVLDRDSGKLVPVTPQTSEIIRLY